MTPKPQCRAKFELANGEFVSRCHLDLGHKGAHEGWCLGSKCHWPQGFTSEEEVNKALDACIVKTRIEIIELEKDGFAQPKSAEQPLPEALLECTGEKIVPWRHNAELSGGGPLSNKMTEAESRRPLE
jgi:hypothetical protein